MMGLVPLRSRSQWGLIRPNDDFLSYLSYCWSRSDVKKVGYSITGHTKGVFCWARRQTLLGLCFAFAPQWGAAGAEIKVPSGENTELRRSPFKAWSRSVYRHTCCAYCQGFLPYFYRSCLSTCIFFQNLSRFLLCLLWLTHGSCVCLQNKICHPA